MKILDPSLIILDETDSGLDIDALKIVADGVNSTRDKKIFFSYYSLSKVIKFYKARLCSCLGWW